MACRCFSEGCSAEECGLSEVACNQTAYLCNDHYLLCAEMEGDVCGCTAQLLQCIEGANCFVPALRTQIFDQCKAVRPHPSAFVAISRPLQPRSESRT